jgi:hypothetical protein
MKKKINSLVFHIIAGTLIIVSIMSIALAFFSVVFATGYVQTSKTCAEHIVMFLICMPIALITIKGIYVFFRTYRYD